MAAEPSRQAVGSAVAAAETLIDLVELVRFIRARWVLLAAGTLVGLVCAVIYLNLVVPKFVATLRVTPAGAPASGTASALGRLGSIAAAAGISTRQANEGASSFELFIEAIQSRPVADALVRDRRIAIALFEREWDSTASRWVERPGLLRPVRNAIYWVAGQQPPAWRPPDGERLQELLARSLGVAAPKAKDAPITTLTFLHKDPSFATYFLTRLVNEADSRVRSASLERATAYARQLSDRLASTEIAEHRKTLSEALLEQERSIMMATGRGAFAALPVEPAYSSSRPVSPNVLQSLLAGVAGGLLTGLVALSLFFLARGTPPKASVL